MPVHQPKGIVFLLASIHEATGKIETEAQVDRTTTPRPTFVVLFFLRTREFLVTIAFAEVSHTTGSGDCVHNSSRNDSLRVSHLSSSLYKWERQRLNRHLCIISHI